VPAVEIVDKDMWGLAKDKLVLKTHAVSNINDAKRNIEISGRRITRKDEQLLGKVLSHWCGWSPTREDHQLDPWVRFLQKNYAHLEHVVPILDSLIWPDEITRYPLGYVPPRPCLFLLATGTRYYVYDFQNAAMNNAGASLQEVYDGLKNRGWDIGGWDEEEDQTDEDPKDYFPVYSLNRYDDAQFKLMSPVREWRD